MSSPPTALPTCSTGVDTSDNSILLLRVKRRRDQVPPEALVLRKNKRTRFRVSDAAELLQTSCGFTDSVEPTPTQHNVDLETESQHTFDSVGADASTATGIPDRLRDRWDRFRHGEPQDQDGTSRGSRSTSASVISWRQSAVESRRSAGLSSGLEDLTRSAGQSFEDAPILDITCSNESAPTPRPLQPLVEYYLRTLRGIDGDEVSGCSNAEYVYDLFACEKGAEIPTELVSTSVVRIDQSWEEIDNPLTFEDDCSDVDSEDSNAEGHAYNSYPDEPSDDDEFGSPASSSSSFCEDKDPYDFEDDDMNEADYYDQSTY